MIGENGEPSAVRRRVAWGKTRLLTQLGSPRPNESPLDPGARNRLYAALGIFVSGQDGAHANLSVYRHGIAQTGRPGNGCGCPRPSINRAGAETGCLCTVAAQAHRA